VVETMNYSPLAHDHPAPKPGVGVRVSPELSIAVIEPTAIAKLNGTEGSRLDDPSFRWATFEADGYRLLWNGPESWLAVSHSIEPAALLTALASGSYGPDATAVDLSHAYSVIRLAGPASAALLATAVPVDVESIRPGGSLGTLFGHYNVHVHAVEADMFDIYVSATMAGGAWELLLLSAEEFRA
jgi:heterotetrameric sarcosine oxidase gamma subunit